MTKQKFAISELELKRLYIDEQQSMADIAIQLGCSSQTVCNLLRKAGIQARSQSAPTPKRVLAKLGSLNPMFGKIRLEHSKLMREKQKGVVFSIATRQKMSAAKNGKWGGKYIGQNHPNWVPPDQRKSPFYKQIRDSAKMHEWRVEVFQRDNYTCQGCSRKGGTLNADHIKQFALILKENGIKTLEEAVTCAELWNIENGRTLCELCHRKTDTFAKRIK